MHSSTSKRGAVRKRRDRKQRYRQKKTREVRQNWLTSKQSFYYCLLGNNPREGRGRGGNLASSLMLHVCKLEGWFRHAKRLYLSMSPPTPSCWPLQTTAHSICLSMAINNSPHGWLTSVKTNVFFFLLLLCFLMTCIQGRQEVEPFR